jgi:hypothetical protein
VLGEGDRRGIVGADGAHDLNMVTLANFPDEVAAFSAFQRSQTAADESFAAEAGQSRRLSEEPGAARALARSVYKDAETRLGIFPAKGAVIFLAMGVSCHRLGVSVPTWHAAANGIGAAHRDEAGSHLWGVLPAGASAAEVTDVCGAVVPVELGPDAGYSVVTLNAPVSLGFVTGLGARQIRELHVQRGRTTHHVPDGKGGLTRIVLAQSGA